MHIFKRLSLEKNYENYKIAAFRIMHKPRALFKLVHMWRPLQTTLNCPICVGYHLGYVLVKLLLKLSFLKKSSWLYHVL